MIDVEFPEPPARARLVEVALFFAKLGVIAFGGPAAHIAMMRKELVERRRWISDAEFMDLVGATNLIPGPNSTELAMHLGKARAGGLGLVVAGACFIVPAASITFAIAWAYVRFGSLPRASGILYGIKPVIVAVVAQALLALAKTVLATWRSRFLFGAALVLAALRVHELALLLGAGLVAIALSRSRDRSGSATFVLSSTIAAGPALAASPSPLSIFALFAKIGSVLYGSGYVLFAFLRAELVTRRGFLSDAQLADAIAVGQMTPGPVFSSATFVGYVIGGAPSALAATAGIFLPAFVFVAASTAIVPRLRRSAIAGAFLDGVNAASLALMAVVSADLAHASWVDVPALVATAVAFALLAFTKVSSSALVALGALFGVAMRV